MMFKLQKDFLRAVVSTDKRVVYYFPRQIGKTYVRNYIKKIGQVAHSEATDSPKPVKGNVRTTDLPQASSEPEGKPNE